MPAFGLEIVNTPESTFSAVLSSSYACLTHARWDRPDRIYKGSRARSSTPRVAAALLCRAWTAPLRCDPPRLWRFGNPSVTGQFRPSKTEIDHERNNPLHHRCQRPAGLSPCHRRGDHEGSAPSIGAANQKGHRAQQPTEDPGLPDDAASHPRVRNLHPDLSRQPPPTDRLRGT